MGEGLLRLFPLGIVLRSLILSALLICTLTVSLGAGLAFVSNEGGPLAGSGRRVDRYFSSKDWKRPTVTGAEGSVISVAAVSNLAFLTSCTVGDRSLEGDSECLFGDGE